MKTRWWITPVSAALVGFGAFTAQAGSAQSRSSGVELAQAGTSTAGQSSSTTSGTSGITGDTSAKSDKSATTASAKDVDSGDKKFMQKAARGGAMEVALGRLAAQRATISQVKQFGQRMVDDHGKANEELKELAARKGIALVDDEDRDDKNGTTAGSMGSVATGPGTTGMGAERMYLEDSDRKMLDKFAGYTGAKFDHEYMEHMVDDHEKDVKEFEDASKNAKDPDIKAFAAKTLPTLQEHLRMAKEAQKLAKNEGSASDTDKNRDMTSPTTTGREGTGTGATGPRDTTGPGTSGDTTGNRSPGASGALTRPPSSDSGGVGSGEGRPGQHGGTGAGTTGSSGDAGSTR